MSKSQSKIPVLEAVKALLEDSNRRIQLDDFVTEHLKIAISNLGIDKFPPSETFSDQTFSSRLKAYESTIQDLIVIAIQIARWGNKDQLASLENLILRLAETDKGSAGTTVWLHLSWYPIQVIQYAAGVAAITSKNFSALRPLFLVPVKSLHDPGSIADVPVLVRASNELVESSELFKRMPGHEQHRVPRSEYLFALLRPTLERNIFIGNSYEDYFDQYEVIASLIYADLTFDKRGRVWGPIGRFGWKHSHGGEGAPYNYLIKTGEREQAQWPLIQAGFFRGSHARFLDIAKGFNELMSKLNWW